MNVLLDTNALLWLVIQSKGYSFGQNARSIIEQADIVHASALSIVEIRIKAMLNKLDVPNDLLKGIRSAGVVLSNFPVEAADALIQFPMLKRHDPFDRMLLAHAYAENLILLTSDKTLLSMQLEFVLDSTK